MVIHPRAGVVALMVGAAVSKQRLLYAIRSFGVVVTVSKSEFLEILSRQEQPLVLEPEQGFFTRYYRYITSYKGLAFYTWSRERLLLAEAIELVEVKHIKIPYTVW